MQKKEFRMIEFIKSIVIMGGVVLFLFQSLPTQAEEMEWQLGEGVEKVIETRYRFSEDDDWRPMKLIYQWPKYQDAKDKEYADKMPEYTDKFSGGKKFKAADDMEEFSLGDNYNEFDKVELGPEVYDRWNRPGLPYPWELTKEEREQIEPIELYHRSYDLSVKEIYAMSWDPCFGGIIVDRKGRVKRKIGKQYQKLHKYYAIMGQPEIKYKSIFLLDQPSDVRGLGNLQIAYMDESKSDDYFLYFPSLRKVRRMSESSKQDSMFGMTLMVEDFYPKAPLHTYRILRTETFKSPGEDVFGFKEDFLKTCVNGIGRECWVLEVIPKRKWYFARRLMWIDKENFILYYSEKYDSKGRLLITMRHAPNLAVRTGNTGGAKDIYLSNFFHGAHNVQRNHRSMFAFYGCNWDAEYHKDDTILSAGHLLRGYYRMK